MMTRKLALVKGCLSIFFSLIFILSSVNSVIAIDEGDEIYIDRPDWCTNALWNYSISLYISEKDLGYLDVKCSNLSLSVIDNNTLLFQGELVGTGGIEGYGGFEIKHCEISGLVEMCNQSDVCRVRDITIEGYAKKGLFSVFPFYININVTFSPSLHIIDFPLYQNKTWNIEDLNITIDGNFDFSVSEGEISESYNISSPVTVICKEIKDANDDRTANLSVSSENVSFYFLYSSNAQMIEELVIDNLNFENFSFSAYLHLMNYSNCDNSSDNESEDIDGPKIVIKGFQETIKQGRSNNITCNISDLSGIKDVWIRITYPNETAVNYSMEKSSSNTYFLNKSYIQLGLYRCRIYAKDIYGNINSSGEFSFLVVPCVVNISVKVPREDRIYLFGRELNLKSKTTIVIGKLRLSFSADNLEKNIRFLIYIDGDLKKVIYSKPLSCEIKSRSIWESHELRIVAEDPDIGILAEERLNFTWLCL